MRHAGGGPRGPCMKSTYSDGQTTEMHVKHIMRNSPQPYRHKMYLAQPAALHAHSNPDESNTPGTRNTWPTALRCPGQSGEARRQHGAALPLPSEHSKLRSSCQPLLHKWASTPCLPPNAADTSTIQLLSGHRMTARTPKFAHGSLCHYRPCSSLGRPKSRPTSLEEVTPVPVGRRLTQQIGRGEPSTLLGKK
jgi:hypothetical protein